VYCHHFFGNARLVIGEGAELRGSELREPLPAPFYYFVNGTYFDDPANRCRPQPFHASGISWMSSFVGAESALWSRALSVNLVILRWPGQDVSMLIVTIMSTWLYALGAHHMNFATLVLVMSQESVFRKC
jgi:hypothetical protein